MSSKKKFMSGLVTKLDNLLIFWKTLWKKQLKLMVSKKLLTDLTLA